MISVHFQRLDDDGVGETKNYSKILCSDPEVAMTCGTNHCGKWSLRFKGSLSALLSEIYIMQIKIDVWLEHETTHVFIGNIIKFYRNVLLDDSMLIFIRLLIFWFVAVTSFSYVEMYLPLLLERTFKIK